MHLVKPVDPGELVASVATLVRRYRPEVRSSLARQEALRTGDLECRKRQRQAVRRTWAHDSRTMSTPSPSSTSRWPSTITSSSSDLSFTVPKGNMRILFGASGAGKSVILKLALGLLRPDAGSHSRSTACASIRCRSSIC